jgi:hypothetical protein
MEDTIIKQEDQTIWYENNDLIEEYLENSKKLSKEKAVGPGEKQSLLKLIQTSLADPTE